jgi:DNA-binding beta-propeller fold protein YncE
VAVSPGGGIVFLTGGGTRTGAASGDDDITVAHNAATGARRWVSRYNGPASLKDDAHSLAVAPGSREVVVTVAIHGRGSGIDYATVAYNAATGARRWARRYNGPDNLTDWATSATVSPGGSIVYVTGFSEGRISALDYATVAHNAATGEQA